jgi:hypothetical protein
MVRDQGVGGSNPLSPTISNQALTDLSRNRGFTKGVYIPAGTCGVGIDSRQTLAAAMLTASTLQLALPTTSSLPTTSCCRHSESRQCWRVPCCPASPQAERDYIKIQLRRWGKRCEGRDGTGSWRSSSRSHIRPTPASVRGSFAGNLLCVAARVRYHSRQVGGIPWQA